LIRERGKDTDTLDDIINAIKVFDQDNDGKIPVEEFKSVMMKMGERMSEAEIMEIISDSELINNNYIQVVDFAKMIMNRV
jgi:Ca2+-binding EF-hand superfamily protein|tara:strand:+ start:532 stop:771 length:240 start_codon:yes stop_codon:yes gene_type:complete